MNSSNQTYLKTAGILYLIIFICAGFSEGFVRSSLIVYTDPVATANNIIASESLFRLGFVTDLIAFISDAVISILFYLLLKPVSKTIALTAATFRLIAHPIIGSFNLINHLSAVNILTDPSLSSFVDISLLQTLAMESLINHKIGYLIAGAFFGIHCLLLGYLLFKSELFPKIIGILIFVASFGYLIESFGNFLNPENSDIYAMIVIIPAVIAELSLCVWLIIKGFGKKIMSR